MSIRKMSVVLCSFSSKSQHTIVKQLELYSDSMVLEACHRLCVQQMNLLHDEPRIEVMLDMEKRALKGGHEGALSE